jgi:hypothetical protein
MMVHNENVFDHGVPPATKAKKTAGLTQVDLRNGHPVIKYIKTDIQQLRITNYENLDVNNYV